MPYRYFVYGYNAYYRYNSTAQHNTTQRNATQHNTTQSTHYSVVTNFIDNQRINFITTDLHTTDTFMPIFQTFIQEPREKKIGYTLQPNTNTSIYNDEDRPDDGGSKVLRNVGKFLPDYMAL
jgi:hypothetical protein